MHPIESFVRNPVKVAVGVLLVALFGVIALYGMPMQLTPEVQKPTISIETAWRGAKPQEIETQIVKPQEDELKNVEGVTKMSSESREGMGVVMLEFAVGANMSEALLKVNSRLQQVREYPRDAEQPVIITSSSADQPIARFILSARSLTAEELDELQSQYPELSERIEQIRGTRSPGLAALRTRRLAAERPEIEALLPKGDIGEQRKFAEDYIETRFERVKGVSNAEVVGGMDPEMQVIVDPHKLAARGLTIPQLRDELRAQNIDVSAGDIWEGKRRWTVRTLGRFGGEKDIEDFVIDVRDGIPVYVRDVAEVKRGFAKPTGLVRRYGDNGISVNVLRNTDANVLDVMDGLQKEMQRLNAGILAQRGLQLTQVYDETEYIYSAVGLVSENIIVGGALTVIVLMLFLHLGARTLIFIPFIAATALAATVFSPWIFAVTLAIIVATGFWFARGSLVIALAIPASIVGTFLVLGLLGRTLNVISLAGLAFAVGMVVDNAIVVLENIFRHHQMGRSPFRAAVEGTQEVWGAVVASTLTTLAVFLPVLFVREEAGQLFRDIALAISAAVGLSMIVAVTVIPPAAARLFTRRPTDADAKKRSAAARAAATGPISPAARHSGEWEQNGDGDEARLNGKEANDRREFHSFEAVMPPDPSEHAPRSLILRFFERLGNAFTSGVVGVNAFLQRSTLLQMGVVVVLTVLSVGITYLAWPKVEYLPNGNRNMVIALIVPPPGYNIDQLTLMGQTVEEELQPYWDIDPDDPKAKELPYPTIEDFFFVVRNRQIFMGARAHDGTRVAELVPLMRQVGGKIPGAIAVASQTSLFARGLQGSRAVEIDITGPDLEKLVAMGGTIMEMQQHLGGRMQMIVGTDGKPRRDDSGKPLEALTGAQASPAPSLDLSAPELQVLPRLPARELSVRGADLGYTVDALIDGAYVGDYYEGTDIIDLTIVGNESYAHVTQDVGNLPIATPDGTLAPLAALADIRLASGPEQINHRERQRAITILLTPDPLVPLQTAIERVETLVVKPLRASGQLGDEYAINIGGTADKLRETWNALSFNFLLALLITYLLMAALFESWLYPFVIIMSVPLGAVGGLLGLLALNFYLGLLGHAPQTLDVLTMLGFVILIGTVVNNPILIVHQSLNHIRDDGMTPNQAILESVGNRIRPIFMTTITTLFGLAPLVFFPGAGSELYRGLGAVVLGGLLISTIFTLVFIPALFSLTMGARAYFLGALGYEVEDYLQVPPESEPPAPREMGDRKELAATR